MSDAPLVQTAAAIVVAGVAGQMLARRLRLPAILPLLLIGVALGPSVAGVVRPAALGGEGLRTLIGFAVAIILFEGGLSLKTESFRLAGTVIRNLVLGGALVTWALSALFARAFFPELGMGPAVLFGALVIVTGPTVILPLLQAVHPRRRVSDALRGEAILIDPVGALYAVLVLEFLIEAGSRGSAHVLAAFGGRLLLGAGLGAVGAWTLFVLIRRREILPVDLRNLAVLATAIGLFAVSELLLPESGVLTVTLAGFLLGWLHPPGLEEIEEFKGHLTVLMVSVVFVLLAADLDLAGLAALGWPALGLVAAIVFVVRPACIALCTLGTELTVRERLFLSWIAPRGIVAAAVSSLFALALAEHGIAEGHLVKDLVFAVICGTVVLQAPTARLVGRLLGVLEEERHGFLIVGANSFALALGRALHRAGLQVVLLDTNAWRVERARERGLRAHRADALDPLLLENLDLDGIGNLLAMTPNDGVNRAALRLFARDFGPGRVRAIRLESSPPATPDEPYLFGERLAWQDGVDRLRAGASLERAEVDQELDAGGLGALLPGAVGLLALEAGGAPRFLADDAGLEVGESLFYLAPPQEGPRAARDGRDEA
ncbi:MAG: cation:proton antiporter [Planctomycetota bacterium]|jgi:NhaP-type Na+/H+ or K+/H+ antiporter|nr:cation:proton antiporter [Planctomycetota bacterium]